MGINYKLCVKRAVKQKQTWDSSSNNCWHFSHQTNHFKTSSKVLKVEFGESLFDYKQFPNLKLSHALLVFFPSVVSLVEMIVSERGERDRIIRVRARSFVRAYVRSRSVVAVYGVGGLGIGQMEMISSWMLYVFPLIFRNLKSSQHSSPRVCSPTFHPNLVAVKLVRLTY